MDTASLDFFTPILDDIDRWAELAPLLPILVLLELVLSADNAVALASITQKLEDIDLQRRSLNIGILISLFFRIGLILTANIIIKYSFIQVLASIYLLSLVYYKFFNSSAEHSDLYDDNSRTKSSSFLRVTLLLAITDLAFSIDSVTAAVAISDQILLVITGAIVGVLALRFTADFFIRWLSIFTNLESAGFVAIALVAIKLLLEVTFNHQQIIEYSFYVLLPLVFLWGFSRHNDLVK